MFRNRFWRTEALLVTFALSWGSPAFAQSGENVLVVANTTSPASVEIADYYLKSRSIPRDHLVQLKLPPNDTVSRADYAALIEAPIGKWLTVKWAQDRILYLVLTKGVPLRITGTAGATGTASSVDSELTLLYRRLTGRNVQPAGPIPNPYFLGDGDLSGAKRFTHRDQDIYLVTRLDGFTVEDVKRLIDRGMTPARQGAVSLTRRPESVKSSANTWLEKAAEKLRTLPDWREAVVLDPAASQAAPPVPLLGYYSWGPTASAAPKPREMNLTFAAGAVAGMYVSTDARTFTAPPNAWRPRLSSFAGSTDPLTGDLIRSGVTGVAGNVAEPLLNGAIRPDVLFPAYVAGFNLAESFYLAMPSLSWQTVIIGDPLCAPFRQSRIDLDEIDGGFDPTTELPRYLSERRVSHVAGTGTTREAAALFAKSQSRIFFNDGAGAIEALEKATLIDPTFVAAHFMLATYYEGVSKFDEAVERYRRAIDRVPNHIAALNNVAYLLAVRKKAPNDALPFATRAYALEKKAPFVLDTLGWIYHLLGDTARATPLLVAAAAGDPQNAEIQLHAATVLADAHREEEARRAIDLALKADPKMSARPEVQELQKRLGSQKQ